MVYYSCKAKGGIPYGGTPTENGLALLLTLCLVIPASMALAEREDALEMQTYWQMVGDMTRTDPRHEW